MAYWLTLQLVLGTVMVTSFTSVGLQALWAATSSRHWSARTAVTLIVPSPLLLIPAYELWSIFALQICVVVTGAQIWRRWTKSRRVSDPAEDGGSTADRHFRLQYSLRTLLAAALLVAIVMAIATRIPSIFPPPTIGLSMTIGLNGIGSGLAVLFGVWAFASRRKRIVWPTIFMLCAALATVLAWFDWLFVAVTFWDEWPPNRATPVVLRVFSTTVYPALAWFAILPAVIVATWLAIRLRFAGWSASESSDSVAMSRHAVRRRNAARYAFGLLLVVVAFPPASVTWRLLNPPPMPHIPFPSPNGFEDITAAGSHFSSSPLLDRIPKPCSTGELAAEIATYDRAYERLRLGLNRKIQVRDWTKKGETIHVPYSYSADHQLDNALMASQALIHQAELARQQNRTDDAATISVECLRLGQAITRNGLLADFNCGLRIEDLGERKLYQVLPHLRANQCREIVATLIEMDRNRESLQDVRRRNRVWHENTGDWFRQLINLLAAVTSFVDVQKPYPLLKKETATRLLIVELALRRYQLECGAPPDRLEELVPEFLPALPLDPFDPKGRPLRYVRTLDSYVLYSVGGDGDDDVGRPLPVTSDGWADPEGDGDLRLDQLFPSDNSSDDAEKESNK